MWLVLWNLHDISSRRNSSNTTKCRIRRIVGCDTFPRICYIVECDISRDLAEKEFVNWKFGWIFVEPLNYWEQMCFIFVTELAIHQGVRVTNTNVLRTRRCTQVRHILACSPTESDQHFISTCGGHERQRKTNTGVNWMWTSKGDNLPTFCQMDLLLLSKHPCSEFRPFLFRYHKFLQIYERIYSSISLQNLLSIL